MKRARRRPLPLARIARLEAERAVKRAEAAKRQAKRECRLYFLLCEDYVKIGYGYDPAQRCRASQVGNPFPVSLVGVMTGGEREERILHRTFRGLRFRAEWFRVLAPLDEVVSTIQKIDDPDDARAWIGEWLLSFNGSMALLPEVEPHKSRHIDHRTGQSTPDNTVAAQ